MEAKQLKSIVEAAIFASEEPVNLECLLHLFTETERPARSHLKTILAELAQDYLDRGIQLKQLATGYCFQTSPILKEWIKRLFPEKPVRYSHAFLETLSIIAYKQPVTRGDIESIRGIAVNPHIMKILLEQDWIHVVDQRDVPGRPNLYATTKQFLDNFGLTCLAELPSVSPAELKGDALEDKKGLVAEITELSPLLDAGSLLDTT